MDLMRSISHADLGNPFRGGKSCLQNTCWACGRLFDNNLLRNDHHVIPSAFGGSDGPQVSLCSPHHILLHNIAERLLKNRDYQSLLVGLETGCMLRVMFLAFRAAYAEFLTRKEPNKRVHVSVTLPASLVQEVNDLTKSLGVDRTVFLEQAIRVAVKKSKPLD